MQRPDLILSNGGVQIQINGHRVKVSDVEHDVNLQINCACRPLHVLGTIPTWDSFESQFCLSATWQHYRRDDPQRSKAKCAASCNMYDMLVHARRIVSPRAHMHACTS